MERAGLGNVHPVRAGTFEDRREAEAMLGDPVEAKAGAAAGLKKKNHRRRYRWDIAKVRETGNDEHV